MIAISKLRNKDRIAVRIIGEGDFSVELAGMIKSLALVDVVQFDNSSYPVHEIPNRITDSHLGLVPLTISSITNYALPVKLLEYTAMGLPAVTVPSAAISYYFGKDDCLFYEADSVESLRAAIDRVVENPAILDECNARAKTLREKFVWSRERDKYVTLLHDLCAWPQTAGTNLAAK